MISVLGKLRQEDHKLKVIFGCIGSSMQAWATEWEADSPKLGEELEYMETYNTGFSQTLSRFEIWFVFQFLKKKILQFFPPYHITLIIPE